MTAETTGSNGSEIGRLKTEYVRLCHAMQSGVAQMMNFNPNETKPKHLRVGVNVTMSDHAALVELLVEKGIMTEVEYFRKLVSRMQDEVNSYRRKIQEHLNTDTEINLA